MQISAQMAKHLREVFFGGNWTFSNFKDQLREVTWEQADKKVENFNTIHALVRHMGYYVTVQLRALRGEPLNASDAESWKFPPINNANDWEWLVSNTLVEAEELARLIEKLPDSKLAEDFFDKKYGNYYRNFAGLIEHTHYHLGQVAILKKLVSE